MYGSGDRTYVAGSHTAANTPDLFRTPKLTAAGPDSTEVGDRSVLRVLPALLFFVLHFSRCFKVFGFRGDFGLGRFWEETAKLKAFQNRRFSCSGLLAEHEYRSHFGSRTFVAPRSPF